LRDARARQLNGAEFGFSFVGEINGHAHFHLFGAAIIAVLGTIGIKAKLSGIAGANQPGWLVVG